MTLFFYKYFLKSIFKFRNNNDGIISSLLNFSCNPNLNEYLADEEQKRRLKKVNFLFLLT